MSSKSVGLPIAVDEFQIRSDITFLNHGSFGACPRPVFATYQEWQRQLEADPVEFLDRQLIGLLDEARGPLAAYVGAGVDDIVFVHNSTMAVNIVARSLMLALEPGDEVLATDHEYGAADRMWRFLCQQRGVTYRNQTVALPLTSDEEMIEQLWQGVTPRTKVLFVSHITSPTALLFPVEKICQRARAAGIITVIDGAHTPGQIALDMEKLGADFYSGNCHKWLCAPKGAGFLYVRPEHQDRLEPLIVSWGWESVNPGASRFQDVFGWVGTDDPAAYLSVPAAIAFQQEHNWAEVRVACHELAAHARREITALTGLEPICPDSPDWWGQMCAMPLADGDAVELQLRLRQEWKIEIPVIIWNNRRLIRISVQGYTSPADVERLLDALKVLLPTSMPV